MSVSQTRIAEWRCARCGEVTSRPTWLAVDAVERPDLIARFSDLIEFECPGCRRPLRRSQPLLVLRLAKAAPLIAARATDDELDPLESLDAIVQAVQHELGDALAEVPGPPVIATFDEIEAGAQANIDANVRASRAGAIGAVGREPAYRELLGKIEAIQKPQRIESGLRELALVASEEQLGEVMEQWPEIMTDEAEHLVAERLDHAPTENARRFARSMLETVQLGRRGDFSGAWSVRESVIRRYQEETVAPRLRAFEDGGHDVTRNPGRLAHAGKDLLAVLPPGAHRRPSGDDPRHLSLLSESGATLREYAATPELVEAVLVGDLDAALVSLAVARESVAADTGRLVMVGPALTLDRGVGIGVREGDGRLSGALDRAIDAMNEDGSPNALITKWFGPDAATF